jgi:chromosomal replication initiation ATPase DnaA
MNLQKELRRVGIKYNIPNQKAFTAELTDLVFEAVADIIEIGERKDDFDQVVSIVAKAFKVKPVNLFRKSRAHYCLTPRQMAQYILREKGHKLEFIAFQFNQDHSTVINSRNKMAQYIDQGYYLKQYEEIIENLEGVGIDNGTPAPEDCPL